MLTNTFNVVGFEIPIMGLMKMDNDCHYFADRQLGFSDPFNDPVLDKRPIPPWNKNFTKIINCTKQG
jgi:hypothetical protein